MHMADALLSPAVALPGDVKNVEMSSCYLFRVS